MRERDGGSVRVVKVQQASIVALEIATSGEGSRQRMRRHLRLERQGQSRQRKGEGTGDEVDRYMAEPEQQGRKGRLDRRRRRRKQISGKGKRGCLANKNICRLHLFLVRGCVFTTVCACVCV